MFTIPKADKKEPRFLIDCIPRNKVTIKDLTLLPNIKGIINWVAARKFRSKIDLTDGYHNIRVHPNSVKYNMILIHIGKFDLLVMLQVDCHAPATMMTAMNGLLRHQLDKTCKIYIDDILIATHTYKEHVKAITEIMNILGKAKIWFNKKKCQILPSRLEILGYILTEKGLEADPTKIRQIQDYSAPTIRKQLQRFMSIVNYLRRYYLNLASISTGLAELQGKTKKFRWNHMHPKAFDKYKELIMCNQILQPINHESGKPIYLITDASQTGIAGWLGQEDDNGKIRPAEFHSRKLKNSQINYGTYQKELFAIYDSLQHFQNTLAGYIFTILTDHRPLKNFISQTQKNAVKNKW